MQTRVALTNQLRAELERFWPGPIGLFSDLDNLTSLAFLRRHLSPADTHGLGEQRLQGFLTRHRDSGHKPASELLAKLRRAPEGRAGELEGQAHRAVVVLLVATLEPIVAQIKQLERQIATAIREHPDGEISSRCSAAGKALITAATMLAEIGDCRARYPTRDALAGDAGQAAVALESGKRKVACFRWACNKRLRDAFDTLADSSRHHNPWAADQSRQTGSAHSAAWSPRTVLHQASDSRYRPPDALHLPRRTGQPQRTRARPARDHDRPRARARTDAQIPVFNMRCPARATARVRVER